MRSTVCVVVSRSVSYRLSFRIWFAFGNISTRSRIHSHDQLLNRPLYDQYRAHFQYRLTSILTHVHSTTLTTSTPPRQDILTNPQKMGLMDSIRSKLELYRLEQRYTRREKRTTFSSGAQYIDGEYVYPTATSSANSSAMATPETETPPAFSPASVSSAQFSPHAGQSSPTVERTERRELERSGRPERPGLMGRSDSFASWTRRDGFSRFNMLKDE